MCKVVWIQNFVNWRCNSQLWLGLCVGLSCVKKNTVAKCHSRAESHLYLRYGEIQANARNDIERNDTVSFQAEYKLHAFQLAFECTEWEKREKKSCRTIVYSPKYMIRQVQVIYCKAYNKKRRFHRIAYAILVPILLFRMYMCARVHVCERAVKIALFDFQTVMKNSAHSNISPCWMHAQMYE